MLKLILVLKKQTFPIGTNTIEQSIAVGDGANDLPMLNLAGLGVAYHAKLKVRASSDNAISNFGLDAILYLIGFSDRDIDEAMG